MAKASKPKDDKKERGNYDEKLAVKGTFADIMNAAVKHRENNTPAKKKS